MKLASIEEWGEHEPCLGFDELRTPFEDYMRSEYASPDLDWNDYGFYQDVKVNLRYIGFCEGAFFMCHHKDNLIEI